MPKNRDTEHVEGVLITTYEYPGELPRGCRLGNRDKLKPGTYALVRIEDVEE